MRVWIKFYARNMLFVDALGCQDFNDPADVGVLVRSYAMSDNCEEEYKNIKKLRWFAGRQQGNSCGSNAGF